MTRLSSLLIVAVLACGLAAANVALSETAPGGQPGATEKGPATKDQRKSERPKTRDARKKAREKAREERRLARRKSRADRRAIRQARQSTCRTQATQRHLRGAAHALYIYRCVRR